MKTSTLTCIVLLCSAASAHPPKCTTVETWRLKLGPYMTTHQIRLLLGDPIDREVSRLAQIWYYEKGPTREAGKVVKRPNSGIVRFERQRTVPRTNRTSPQPTFVVISFTEPDSPNVPPDAFKSRQQLAREQQAQAALKKRKAAEEQRLRAMKEREAFAKERQQQLEPARKEQQALFEERRQVLARMQADETSAPEEPENDTKTPPRLLCYDLRTTQNTPHAPPPHNSGGRKMKLKETPFKHATLTEFLHFLLESRIFLR